MNPAAGKYDNFPTAYDEVPNAIEPDQEVLYIERQPDTVQTEHFDWGFRLSGLWGLDYRFTTAKGYFSQQLLGHPPGKEYGFDPVMMYLDLYFPTSARAPTFAIGRYISLPDIEAQLAPNNYTYSHSLLYTFDCYTQTGINATTRINSHWTTQVGLVAGLRNRALEPDGLAAHVELVRWNIRGGRARIIFTFATTKPISGKTAASTATTICRLIT